MKSWVLLSSNLPSVIDQSNLSPSREAQGTQKTDNRTDSRNGASREKNQLQPVESETGHYRRVMPGSCPLT